MVYWILPRAQTDRRDVCGTGVFNFRPLIMPRHILDFVSKFERSENLRYRILDSPKFLNTHQNNALV